MRRGRRNRKRVVAQAEVFWPKGGPVGRRAKKPKFRLNDRRLRLGRRPRRRAKRKKSPEMTESAGPELFAVLSGALGDIKRGKI